MHKFYKAGQNSEKIRKKWKKVKLKNQPAEIL
jgi:hypothetical protein